MRNCMREAYVLRGSAHRKLTYRVPEARIDEIKRQFIADRDSKKVEALEVYKMERIAAMKRHAGLKDKEPAPAPTTEFARDTAGRI